MRVIGVPGVDTRAKLPFYFDLDVREVILVDRDTREVEILRRGASRFEPAPPTDDGWHVSELLGTELRAAPSSTGDRPELHLRRSDEPTRIHVIRG